MTQGGTPEQVKALLDVAEPWEPAEGSEDAVDDDHPYRASQTGLVWLKHTKEGLVEMPLTNFTAKIVADVAEDDGAEVLRRFEIEATLHGRSRRFTIQVGS